jgi:hypothetical protein
MLKLLSRAVGNRVLDGKESRQIQLFLSLPNWLRRQNDAYLQGMEMQHVPAF